jgi:hypothetical protein
LGGVLEGVAEEIGEGRKCWWGCLWLGGGQTVAVSWIFWALRQIRMTGTLDRCRVPQRGYGSSPDLYTLLSGCRRSLPIILYGSSAEDVGSWVLPTSGIVAAA